MKKILQCLVLVLACAQLVVGQESTQKVLSSATPVAVSNTAYAADRSLAVVLSKLEESNKLDSYFNDRFQVNLRKEHPDFPRKSSRQTANQDLLPLITEWLTQHPDFVSKFK